MKRNPSPPAHFRLCRFGLLLCFLRQPFVPPTHPVDLTVTVGSDGLGLILGEEKEGTRWTVKGFRKMPGGEKSPAEVRCS